MLFIFTCKLDVLDTIMAKVEFEAYYYGCLSVRPNPLSRPFDVDNIIYY